MRLVDEEGVELVAQPRQITRLEIGYARSAKLINVRHLKSVLWNMIESNISSAPDGGKLSPPTKKTRVSVENEADTVESEQRRASNTPSSFGDLLTALPANVSKQTAGDLSVAIGLNCLLHLANEKVR